MGQHLTDEEKQDLYRAIARNDRSISKISKACGVNRTTVTRAHRDLLEAGLGVLTGQEQEDPPTPEERHDSRFWSSKARKMEQENEALHAMIREVGALDGLKIRAPEWLFTPSGQIRGSAALIVHNSDRHLGEVVEADEVNGWNAYNVDICKRRVKRFMDAACEIGQRWMSDTRCDGVLYTMGGDEISGDIHDELRETNEITSLESVHIAAETHIAGLRQLAGEYGRVHVVAVPGNHGRTTRKPTAKKYGALSYDIMIARLVARMLQDDERISFDIASGPDVMTMVYGRRVLTTHGDKIGTGGGKGFAGPVLPIIRGATQVKLQYGSSGNAAPDLILMGHYHTSAAPPGILANGSLVGMSEFGFGIRGRFDVPRQWLAVMRSRWGLTERADVQLEDPVQPEKPRVRIGG